MDHLIKIGLLERNPGYGHPLRPEFRLTQLGIEAAAANMLASPQKYAIYAATRRAKPASNWMVTVSPCAKGFFATPLITKSDPIGLSTVY